MLINIGNTVINTDTGFVIEYSEKYILKERIEYVSIFILDTTIYEVSSPDMDEFKSALQVYGYFKSKAKEFIPEGLVSRDNGDSIDWRAGQSAMMQAYSNVSKQPQDFIEAIGKPFKPDVDS